MNASVLSQKSVAKLEAGPVAAVPHGSARPPGRCTAAGALQAPTGRLRAGVGTLSGATRLLQILNELLTQHTRTWSSRWTACLGAVLGAVLWATVWAALPEHPPVPAALQGEALEVLRGLAVQHNGRIKPFDSYARELLALLTGRSRLGDDDSVATIFAIAADPSAWAEAKVLSIPYGPLRQELGIDQAATHVSYNELVETRRLMRILPRIAAKQERDEKLTMLEQEAMDLFDRFVVLTKLMQQEFPIIPPSDAGEPVWVAVGQSALRGTWEELLQSIARQDPTQVARLAAEVKAQARGVNPLAWPPEWRLALELRYNHLRPFAIARVLYALAAVLLLIGLQGRGARLWRAGVGLVAVAAAVHAGGIVARVVIGGRPPVSNFYETMLWLPFVAVVLALVFEAIYRSGYFGLSAAMLAGITLLLADYVPLDSSISPVVAVLRSNLWLTVHVLTIVASYGALALATVLAHVYGFTVLFGRGPRRPSEALDLFLYRTIQVGVVLLAGGIMLGAVWANASWGRYWGWDPKETWALITLLWFIAVLHGRFAGWLKGVGVALSTITGFFLLLMTYYGVSFYLVGLHSYAGGHAKPLPPLLIAYLIAEVVFIALVGIRAATRRSTTSSDLTA